MRARVIVGGIVSSAAVLVIGWHLGGQPSITAQQGTASGSGSSSASGSGSSSASGSDSSGGASTGSSGGASTGSSGGASTGSSGTSGSGSTVSGTFAGDTTQTRFGPVQVQITVSNGKITDVTALQLTNSDGRSIQISQQAAPILRQEALQAQSAQIQSVSGATFTSEGYTTSLQSAIDKAGL